MFFNYLWLDLKFTVIEQGFLFLFFRDLRRVAEVWLDGYKRFFYANRPAARMTSHGRYMAVFVSDTHAPNCLTIY